MDAFRERLVGLTDDDAGVLSGQLQHLGLEEVRDALAAEWPALAPQVMSFAATRLELWTGRHDEVRRHGEAGFVIKFSGRDRQAADQQAKRLALRLKAELLEAFPQLVDGAALPRDIRPAHTVMARQVEAAENLRRSCQPPDGSDARLWRSALGQAVLELLEADREVSVDALIAQLQLQPQDELVLRAASVDAAVQRLRQLLARAASTDASQEAPTAAGDAA
jgi:hypothetical protein